MGKIDWVRKLTSRKFWLAVAGFVVSIMILFGASESEAAKVASLIMQGAIVVGYIIGEGLADSGDTVISIDPESFNVADDYDKELDDLK